MMKTAIAFTAITFLVGTNMVSATTLIAGAHNASMVVKESVDHPKKKIADDDNKSYDVAQGYYGYRYAPRAPRNPEYDRNFQRGDRGYLNDREYYVNRERRTWNREYDRRWNNRW